MVGHDGAGDLAANDDVSELDKAGLLIRRGTSEYDRYQDEAYLPSKDYDRTIQPGRRLHTILRAYTQQHRIVELPGSRKVIYGQLKQACGHKAFMRPQEGAALFAFPNDTRLHEDVSVAWSHIGRSIHSR